MLRKLGQLSTIDEGKRGNLSAVEAKKKYKRGGAWRWIPPLTVAAFLLLATGISKATNAQNKFEMKHAGLCQVQGCTGTKTVREAWSTDAKAVDAAESTAGNAWTKVVLNNSQEYSMLTRDPKYDQFISGALRNGRLHDPHIGHIFQSVIRHYYDQTTSPTETSQFPLVILDVGTNIGYFTSMALAMGARVISFEPMRSNYGAVMATVRKNNWQQRHYLYINALSFEGSIVQMEPTNLKINLSNGHVKDQNCEGTTTTGQYGVDWMESVSLDQVMLTRHEDILRVQLMKVDIEKFEVHAINGAIRFLCNRIVETIAMEVAFLKGDQLKTCDAPRMHKLLEQMGYEVWDRLPTDEGAKNLTTNDFNQFPSDVVFSLTDKTKPPIQRLLVTENNPCQGFEWL